MIYDSHIGAKSCVSLSLLLLVKLFRKLYNRNFCLKWDGAVVQRYESGCGEQWQLSSSPDGFMFKLKGNWYYWTIELFKRRLSRIYIQTFGCLIITFFFKQSSMGSCQILSAKAINRDPLPWRVSIILRFRFVFELECRWF